jgi:hypothetical protein
MILLIQALSGRIASSGGLAKGFIYTNMRSNFGRISSEVESYCPIDRLFFGFRNPLLAQAGLSNRFQIHGEVRNDSESCEESQLLFCGSPFAPDSF